MKYFKIMAVKSFLVLLGVFAMSACNNSLDDLKGPPAVETVVDFTPTGSTNDIFPVGVETKNKWSVEMVFNSGVPMELANISNFTISGGMAVIESVSSADASNRITIYLSNQSPTETYTISVISTNIIDVQQTFSTNMDDTNQTSITNLTRVEGDSYSFKGYGHDDQTPPILDIFYPKTKIDINRALNEKLAVYGFAYDDVELSKIEYKIDSGNYVEITTASFTIDVDVYALGDHTATIRATDIRGNTTARSVDFHIYNYIPSLAITSPQSPYVFIPGNKITIETVSSNHIDIYQKIKIISPLATYDFVSMTAETPSNYSYDYYPDWKESGVNIFIVMQVYTNLMPYETNIVTNEVTLYDNAIYLSATGNDSGDGTYQSPVKTVSKATTIASSVGIQKVKVSAGQYGNEIVNAGAIVLDAGYSSDFTLYNYDVFRAVFNSIGIGYVINVTVRNLFIEQGSTGVNIYSAQDIIISNCNITSSGRGLHASSSTIYIKNCNIHNCDAGYGDGGGIYFYNVNGEIKNNTIKYNKADYGAGICLNRCSPVISGNTINNNTAISRGGGIYISHNSSPTISGNTINNNKTTDSYYGHGGGILLYYSSATIGGNTIKYNSSSRGGGILLYYSSATISWNTINNNTASEHGGGIFIDECSPTINNNIIRYNSADEEEGCGGGLFLFYNCSSIIRANRIEYNTSYFGGGLFLYNNCSPSIIEGWIYYNDYYGIARMNTTCNPTITGWYAGNTPSFKNW